MERSFYPCHRVTVGLPYPSAQVLPKRLEIDIPPSVTSVAEAAVGRDTIMRAVASAVLQADAVEQVWIVRGQYGRGPMMLDHHSHEDIVNVALTSTCPTSLSPGPHQRPPVGTPMARGGDIATGGLQGKGGESGVEGGRDVPSP